MNVPSDQQFLEILYQEWADPYLVNAIKESMANADALDEELRKGPLAIEDAKTRQDIRRELQDPLHALRGTHIKYICEHSLAILGNLSHRVRDIPVGLLPTRQLNACAVRTPKGGAVVLLDSGSIGSLLVLMESYAGMDSWRTGHPICTELSQEQFGNNIINLAKFCATGVTEYFRNIQRPSLRDEYIELICNQSTLMEVFILLHEYGHVILNHLDTANTTRLMISPTSSVEAYSQSQLQEFDADRFAFDMMAAHGNAIMKKADIAVTPGLLFGFFALIEAFDSNNRKSNSQASLTHPPPMFRWHNILNSLGPGLDSNAHASNIESWYECLKDYGGLK